MSYKNRATVFVVSGPSGSGKSSLLEVVLKRVPSIRMSVSYTTRPQRRDEIPGQDYIFVSQQVFLQMNEQGKFLEWAKVFDYYYGTEKRWVDQQINGINPQSLILEIDWQGCRQIQQAYKQMQAIFILPPSIASLRDRLLKRGLDEEAVVENRLQKSHSEIPHCREYNHLILNDDFTQAAADLTAILSYKPQSAHRQRVAEQTSTKLIANQP